MNNKNKNNPSKDEEWKARPLRAEGETRGMQGSRGWPGSLLRSAAVCEGLGIWEPSRQDVKRKGHLGAEITRDVQTAFPATLGFAEGKEWMGLCRRISLQLQGNNFTACCSDQGCYKDLRWPSLWPLTSAEALWVTAPGCRVTQSCLVFAPPRASVSTHSARGLGDRAGLKASWPKPPGRHHSVGAGEGPCLETTCQMLQEVRKSFVVAARIWGASLAGASVDVLKRSRELVGEMLGCGP